MPANVLDVPLVMTQKQRAPQQQVVEVAVVHDREHRRWHACDDHAQAGDAYMPVPAMAVFVDSLNLSGGTAGKERKAAAASQFSHEP